MSIISIISQKCPRCHKGHLFQDRNPFNFSTFSRMNKECSECGLKTEPEPGFYFGAMYISYGLSVGVFLTNFLLFAILFPISGILFIILNTLLLLLLWPLIFRLARTIYLGFFVRFDPKAEKKHSVH